MADRRDRIIVATNELFRRHGYNGTSLSQISQASNATIGSIYHFFPGGKEALAAEVIETTAMIYRELFQSIVGRSSDPAEAYTDFFVAAASVLHESDYIDPCPIGTVAREVANTSEVLRSAAAKAFDSWIDAAEQHLLSVGVSDESAKRLAHVFVATVEGMFVLSRTKRSTEPLVSAGELLSGLVRSALEETSRSPAGS